MVMGVLSKKRREGATVLRNSVGQPPGVAIKFLFDGVVSICGLREPAALSATPDHFFQSQPVPTFVAD